MAFFYIPAESADLHRWLNISKNWYQMPFSKFFETFILTSTTPAAYLTMYLCSFFKNDGVLPALCSFIFFYNLFYIFKDLNKNHGYNINSLTYVLLFVMSSGCFLEVISGVRSFMALSIIGRCSYDELYNGKSFIRNLPICIYAALTHPLALIIYVFRISYLVFQKSKSLLKQLFNLILLLVMAFLLFHYGSSYFDSALNRAEVYITSDNSYFNLWEYLMQIISTVVLVFSIWNTKDAIKSTKFKNMYLFNVFILLIELLFLYEYNTFHRMTTFSLIINIPVVYNSITLNRQMTRKQFILYTSLIILIIACTRGNLSGYKFFI